MVVYQGQKPCNITAVHNAVSVHMPKARDESANDHESMIPKARDYGMRRSTSHHGVADADKLAAWIGARENKKTK